VADGNEMISFREYGAILRRSWLVILFFAAVGLAAAYFVTGMKTPVYRSQTELALESVQPVRGLSSEVGAFKRWDDTFSHTQIQILRSDFLTRRAVSLLLDTLRRPPEAKPASAAGATAVLDDMHGTTLILREESRSAIEEYVSGRDVVALSAELKSGIVVGLVPKTRVLRIQTRSACPHFAAAAANTLACAYSHYVSEASATSSERVFRLLQRQEQDVTEGIKTGSQQLLELKKRSEMAMLSERIRTNDNESVSDALRDELAVGDPEISALTDELLTVQASTEDLSHRYKPEHPKIKELLAKGALIETQITRLKERVYAAWRRRHQEERNAIEYTTLEQDIAASRRLHELLLGKMKELDFSKQTSVASVRVLERAEPPSRPAYPNKALNVVLGALAGLMLGVFAAFVRAHGRTNLVSLAVPEDALPSAFIGRLPHIASAESLEAILGGRDSKTPAAEAIKTLRTSVEAMLKTAGNPVALITSPDRSDGKSTVSVALAQSFAALGRRVLLMDVDLRRGHLHTVLGVAATTPGLTDYLCGQDEAAPLEIAEGLHFFVCGTSTEQPSELLASARMASLMAEFAQAYDVVILDSPPLLPVTDASLLARYAGTRLMVVRSLRTHLEACRFAANILANLGCPVDGLVLNDVRAEESAYYGYYHRYYHRGYDSSSR
jgi:capsular exopolysaccharide synthesis family protein